MLSRYKQAWIDRDASTGDVPDTPNVVMGWDERPWGRVKPGTRSYIADPKAENFEAACRDAKTLVDAKPADRWDSKLVVFDNWTEFGEGHYLEPTTERYLTQIRSCIGKTPPLETRVSAALTLECGTAGGNPVGKN